MRKRGQNEGSIYRMKDGRWRAAVSVGWKNGKRVRKTFTGKTRVQVAEKLKEALRSQQLGLPIAPEKQTVGQFLERWLADTVEKTTRPRTYQSYSEQVRLHLNPDLGRIPLPKLSPQHIQRYLNEKSETPLSARSVQYQHAIVRSAFSFCH